MSMVQEIIYLLLHTAFTIYITLMLLRTLLPLAQADIHNPLSQLIFRTTQPAIKPLRPLLPLIGRLDTAALTLALLLKTLELVLFILLLGGKALTPLIIIYSLYQLFDLTLNIFFFSIIIQAIASWIAPNNQHPALSIIHSLAGTILQPIRRIIREMPSSIGQPLLDSRIDFSPMIALLIIYIMKIILRHLFVS